MQQLALDQASVLARFMEKVRVDPETGCWEWQAVRDAAGYGQFRFNSQMLGAHRVGYELLVGPVAEDMELDHLCRKPACVNPVHLEPVTHRENMLRGENPSAINARKQHCGNGHVLDYRAPSGRRDCHICMAERARKYRSRLGQGA